MKGNDEKLCISEKERGKVCKHYLERIMIGITMWKGIQ